MTTSSTVVAQWEDAPENGRSANEWPYPTRYQRCLITGDLADAVRERLGLEEHVPVMIVETVVSGGWSEYTQENDYYHLVEAGGFEINLGGGGSGWGQNGVDELLKWLDEVDG